MNRYSEIVAEIENQFQALLRARAVFPYMKEDIVGAMQCSTAPFYRNYGFDVTFSFAEPLTAEQIRKLNGIGHWINQNYVVRLCALLESYKIISQNRPIDPQLGGHEEIDILRRLRNKFAHTSGWYDPSGSKDRKLRERIISHFSLQAEDCQMPPVMGHP